MESIKSDIKHFNKIEVQKPSDIIIRQIRQLISSGKLKPGDHLPPERQLAEQLGTGRGHVREAIKKLEFYGILKTYAQSGTVVANLGVQLIEGLIANVLSMEADDFKSFFEARKVLEINLARFCAERILPEQINALSQALDNYRFKVNRGEDAMNEDMIFHLKIAEFSKNPVLRSMTAILIPEINYLSKRFDTCRNNRPKDALLEHESIFEAIKNNNGDQAAQAMGLHMDNTMKSHLSA